MRLLFPPLLALLLAAACGQAPPTAPEEHARASVYVPPPTVLAVEAEGGGSVVIRGRAAPDERVRLIEMDGTAHGVTAGADGRFSLAMPSPRPTDRLISLNAQRTGQSVSSDGWLFSPATAPERAVMLRPGGPSRPVGSAPLLATLDIDAGGGAALGGAATPGQELQVRINGANRGRPVSGPDGVWTLVLGSPLAAGEQRIQVIGPESQVDRTITPLFVRPGASLESATVQGAIRVAWALPGGGAQTTYILQDAP